tara:strand:- start:714 stop:1499 length:786 start_codon:yes stop_codon:yes gene_type:complete
MYGLGVNKLGVTNVRGGFNPLSLFASGEQGAWYDPSDLSSMKQLSDGTVDAVVGQPVGYLRDKSGNANHAIQATSSKRPTLRESGGLYYLEFSGAQGLRTASNINFTGTDTMSAFLGVKKDNDDSTSLVEFSNTIGSGSGKFRFASDTGGLYRWSSRGDVLSNANSTGNNAPTTNVLTAQSEISEDLNILRIDGVQAASSTSNQGVGNYSSDALNIGARNNALSLHLTGRIYSIIIRNVLSSDTEINSTEAYVASKTGVSL